jgi:peptide deformylase
MAEHETREDGGAEEQERGADIPPLVTLGHPLLARPSARVELARLRGDAFQTRLRTLHDAMTAHRGIGIAAPQLGWFERFFLMGIVHERESQEPELEVLAWINPEIVETSGEQGWAWEGCLSVPGLRGWIRRPLAVAVTGYTARGERISREYKGWPARVFQHEFDHLDGMLFPYRAQDPRHVVTLEQLARREDWPDDWPAQGAARAPFGEVIPEADL